MKSYLAKSRLVPLVLIFGMILLIFCGVLYNTQILNGSDYKARSLASNATAQTVEASRGIITDRNGKVLRNLKATRTATTPSSGCWSCAAATTSSGRTPCR